mmetsp:Transcript_30935/g.81262  ORF Transcript_30935/g.81262 Transcript_30935/m.81262 type:complete len:237 (-) Transcript_30935:1227-1937(-)
MKDGCCACSMPVGVPIGCADVGDSAECGGSDSAPKPAGVPAAPTGDPTGIAIICCICCAPASPAGGPHGWNGNGGSACCACANEQPPAAPKGDMAAMFAPGDWSTLGQRAATAEAQGSAPGSGGTQPPRRASGGRKRPAPPRCAGLAAGLPFSGVAGAELPAEMQSKPSKTNGFRLSLRSEAPEGEPSGEPSGVPLPEKSPARVLPLGLRARRLPRGPIPVRPRSPPLGRSMPCCW